MLVGLFRILLILVLFYFLLKLFRNLFSRPSSASGKSPGFQSNRKEGDITIDHMPDQEKTVREDSGEYVDYEDVDE